MKRTSGTIQRCTLSILAAAALVACSEGPRPTLTELPDATKSYDIATLAAALQPSFYDITKVAATLQPSFEDRAPRVLFSMVPGPGQVELVTNGSFEINGGVNSQVFTGWENFNQPGFDPNGFRVQTGTLSPSPGGIFPVPAPPQGLFTAMSTQNGPGLHIISQVITLPPRGNGQLFFRLFIGNRAGAFFSPDSLSPSVFPNQQFRMDIVDPVAPIDALGAAVLMNVYQTRPGDPPISAGYLTVTADLSAFNGMAVRLRFAEADNQFFFNAGVDDVSVIAQVNPTDEAQCKQGGWEAFGFKNEGQCIRFVETGKDNRTA